MIQKGTKRVSTTSGQLRRSATSTATSTSQRIVPFLGSVQLCKMYIRTKKIIIYYVYTRQTYILPRIFLTNNGNQTHKTEYWRTRWPNLRTAWWLIWQSWMGSFRTLTGSRVEENCRVGTSFVLTIQVKEMLNFLTSFSNNYRYSLCGNKRVHMYV